MQFDLEVQEVVQAPPLSAWFPGAHPAERSATEREKKMKLNLKHVQKGEVGAADDNFVKDLDNALPKYIEGVA